MRFALFNDKRVEASPKLKGQCPGCFKSVIAKCGTQKLHHWAHERDKTCDSWWEPETNWHRTWKNHFPIDWQEIFLTDEITKENHIADVRTRDGLTLEFQHSFIDSKERISREVFYKNMIWIVDGTKLKRDFPRFYKAKKYCKFYRAGMFRVEHAEQCFPGEWVSSTVPVVFDFLEESSIDLTADQQKVRQMLYCLFPVKVGIDSYVAEISRAAFIKAIKDGSWLSHTKEFMQTLSQMKQAHDLRDQLLRLALADAELKRSMQMRQKRGRPRW